MECEEFWHSPLTLHLEPTSFMASFSNMASFSKFVRPETPKSGVITDRDLDIIEAILRYRFSPTFELTRLVGGHEDVNVRRLRKLWEWGYVSHVICEDRELLYEEAPQAYKNITIVIDDLVQAGLVDVLAVMKPLVTYKVRR